MPRGRWWRASRALPWPGPGVAAVRGPPTSSPAEEPTASATRDPRPWQVLVDPDVARQAEDPLAEDVALDLGGAALDRVRPRPEEHLARPARRTCEAEPLASAHRVVVADGAVDAEQVDAQLVDPHVDLGEHELRDRALGTRVPSPPVVSRTAVREAQHLGFDPDPHEPVPCDRVRVRALLLEDPDGLRDGTRATLGSAAAPADRAPLVHQR